MDKTKIIIFSRGKVRKHKIFKFNAKEVTVVDDYLYLGVVFNYNNSFTKAINRQLTLAKRALFALNSKISNQNLPVDLKLSLFDRLVIPVLTYGCEVCRAGFMDGPSGPRPGARGPGGPALGGYKRPLLRTECGRGREGGGGKKGKRESKGRSKGASSSKIPLK